jgi:DNA polymerase bacteriophage-type
MNDRMPGATFAADTIGWIDFESRSDTDIKRAGAVRYATEADAIVLAYAIGDAPPVTVSVTAFNGPLTWADMPGEVQMHHLNVQRGGGIWAAWNAGFDRAIWNFATIGFPELEPHQIIDVMAQATASGLPPDLMKASQTVGAHIKVAEGKDLVPLFCLPKGLKGVRGTPQSHPAEWAVFCDDYARGDIWAMQSVFRHTRQLTLAEWREYWAMETINARGAAIDLAMVRRAADLAAEDRLRSRHRLCRLTDNEVQTVDQVARMTQWLLNQLPQEGQAILVRRDEEVDEETGEVTRPKSFSLTRKRVERLIAYCQNYEPHSSQAQAALDVMLEVLQVRLYGGSRTPAKFQKMLDSHVDGVLYGQYVFNGAAQTGRASSRGVQVHNLARDTLEAEPELLDALTGTNEPDYEQFASIGDATPVARKLSLLIRPAFVSRETNVFVWSDWSQIEARIVPWLCDHMLGAHRRLEIFRAVDADPSLPDLYTRSAAAISRIPVEEVTKPIRQRGKVAELALGFGGGVNALQSMGAAYGIHVSDADARIIVDRWRDANAWAIDYGQEIWEAVRRARMLSGVAFQAGRIWLKFERGYLGGSLLARLPSGRCLTYRAMRDEDVDVLDEDDKPTGKKRRELTFARGYGRIKLWPGLFVENFTQATAADFLRGTLVRMETHLFNTRLHTHDECLVECLAIEADDTSSRLRQLMQEGFDWSEGLPLMSEETIGYYYTKHEGSHGL